MEVRIRSGKPSDEIRTADPGPYRLFQSFGTQHFSVSRVFVSKFISDLLDSNSVSEWVERGYLIISQPASGKSTFVLERLIPKAVERGKRVAIIVPRTALALQYKKEIAAVFAPSILRRYTAEGLNLIRSVGPVDVIKFQELADPVSRAEFCKKAAGRYEYVVFDETHAFVGDALFNRETSVIFRDLVLKAGRGAKRVYLTATPDIIANEIIALENEARHPISHQYYVGENWINTVVFRFMCNYEFITPVFFSKYDEILKTIGESSDEEKALFFVSSKEQGRALEREFGKDKAVFIDAETKLESRKQEFIELLDTSKFKQKMLIVTRFLDVGVNLKDKLIKHVIVDSFYQEDVVQMAGRRRPRQGENDTFQLYIRIPSLTRLNQERQKLLSTREELRQMMEGFSQATGAYVEVPAPYSIQKRGRGGWFQANEYSLNLCNYHLQAVGKLLAGISTQTELEDRFIEEVLSWLPGHLPEIRSGKGTDAAVEKAVKLLEGQIGATMSKTEYGSFCDRIFEALQVRRRRAQEGAAATNALNRALHEYDLPYHAKNLSKEEAGKGKYMIERGYAK